MIDSVKKIKVGTRIIWDSLNIDWHSVSTGDILEVTAINEYGDGCMRNLTKGTVLNGWDFNYDRKHMTLLDPPKPYKHVPIKHAYFYHSVGD